MKTQGRRLIAYLKVRPLTYLDMNLLAISVSPHRRIMESLAPDEELVKTKDFDGHTRWQVVSKPVNAT